MKLFNFFKYYSKTRIQGYFYVIDGAKAILMQCVSKLNCSEEIYCYI